MRDIFTVFRFTLRDGLRKKVFLITTIVVLVVILAGCAVVGVVAGDKGGGDSQPSEQPAAGEPTSTCYWLDEGQAVPGALDALQKAFPEVRFVAGKAASLEAYKAEIEEDSDVSVVAVEPGSPLPKLKVYTADFMSGPSSGGIASVVKAAYVANAFEAAGVSEDLSTLALAEVGLETVTVGKMDLSGYVVGILLTMLIFFAVYYYGYGVAMSVAAEKTSRVMETLVVSAKPSHILLGKCLGMGVLGLFQLVLFLLAAAAGYQLFIPADFTIGGMPLALSAFSVSSALLILVYFLLGYALYALLNSVCGATVSRAEDLNSAMMPTVLVSLVSFYAAYMAIMMPISDTYLKVVTYLPLTSPFVLPFRLLNETVPAADLAISVGLLLVGILLVALLSVRLYTASVLHYGERIKLRNLWKMKV